MSETKRPILEESNFLTTSIDLNSKKPPKIEHGDVVTVFCDGISIDVSLYPFEDTDHEIKGQIVEIEVGCNPPQNLSGKDTIWLIRENIFGIKSKASK